MTYSTKQKLIKHFQTLKSIGYTYHEPVDFHLTEEHDSIDLPHDLSGLESVVSNCNLCELSKYTKNKFFASGNSTSKVMFIGDYPVSDNFNPFNGQSGKMLSAMCNNVLKLDIKDVYYTSILKCNVPVSNTVHNDNIDCCKDYLVKQIDIVKPLVIIVFDTDTYKHLNTLNIFENQNIILTSSPTFLLRNPSHKKQALQDLQKVKSILDKGDQR